MTLALLSETLNAKHQPDGTFRLTPTLDGVKGWATVWECLASPSDIVLREASVELGGDVLILRGLGEVLGIPDTALSWVFEDDDDGASVSLGVSFEASARIEVPGATFGVADAGFEVFVPGAGEPLTGLIRASVKAGSLSLPIVVRLPAEAGVWAIEGSSAGIPLSRLDQLADLMGELDRRCWRRSTWARSARH
jgi:hypothetical protein